jgi:hypothetical protein
MSLTPEPAPILPRCKIKRVNPAFRSVSTPRSTKDLLAARPVNPSPRLAPPHRSDASSEWSAERLCERLRIELAPAAWTRLIQAARRHGTTLERLLHSALSDVA